MLEVQGAYCFFVLFFKKKSFRRALGEQNAHLRRVSPWTLLRRTGCTQIHMIDVRGANTICRLGTRKGKEKKDPPDIVGDSGMVLTVYITVRSFFHKKFFI
jgi:hypothetical protein